MLVLSFEPPHHGDFGTHKEICCGLKRLWQRFGEFLGWCHSLEDGSRRWTRIASVLVVMLLAACDNPSNWRERLPTRRRHGSTRLVARKPADWRRF